MKLPWWRALQFKARRSQIYFLPKIHKDNNPDRLIVSVLVALLSYEFLTSFPNDSKFLFPMDIKSLHGEISDKKEPSTEFPFRSAELVFT